MFADERLLSSDPDNWDQFVREAHEAEGSSRKRSKRVREGYKAKRRRPGVPGGNRPPLGYLRVRADPENPRSPQRLVMDTDRAPVIRRAYELSASGLTDREVAVIVGLKVTHLREILKNPVYIGQLRTGEVSGGPGADLQGALGQGHGRPLQVRQTASWAGVAEDLRPGDTPHMRGMWPPPDWPRWSLPAR